MKKILPILILIILFICSCNLSENLKQYTKIVVSDDKQGNKIDLDEISSDSDTKLDTLLEDKPYAVPDDADDNIIEYISDGCANEAYWYAYQNLNNDLKSIYVEIINIINNQETDIPLSTTDLEIVDYVFKCIFMDHPELFWIDGYTITQYKENENIRRITFSGNYTMTKEKRQQLQESIDEVVTTCISSLPEDADDYEKVKFVYEYVIKNTDYDLQSEQNQNIISVFLNKKSVCQGYAYAVHYLLNRVAIPCVTVTGTVNNGNPHSWNIVLVNGNYYFVDATWGDSSYILENTDESSLYDRTGEINYDFLLITTDMLNRTHISNNVIALPACESMEDNYYVKEGKYFTGLDTERLHDLFDNGYKNNELTVSIMCQNETVFQELNQYLINESKIFDYIKNSKKITYIKNDEQLTYQFFL